MMHTRTFLAHGAISVSLGLGVCGVAMASDTQTLGAKLSGSSEVPDNVESPIKGSAALTDAQVADLMAGKWYINLHTAANPGGEVRGRVMPSP